MDTSDAAYERRHHKYELMEKRQRLREKEKLKHEQYKLKERIEQLRAMDGAAFLSLPSESFSPLPTRSNEEEDEERVATLLGTLVNGSPTNIEGERRRKEMLDLALALEERYRILLPPERKGAEKVKKIYQKSPVEVNGDVTGDETGGRGDDGESERDLEEEEAIADVSKGGRGKIRLKIKFLSRAASTSSKTPAKTVRQRKVGDLSIQLLTTLA